MALVLSQAGQNFIKINELGMTSISATGKSKKFLTTYQDDPGNPNSPYLIGWGHSFGANPTPETITPAQAQALFNSDTQVALTTLGSTVNATQLATLSPQQIAACCDFIYNRGSGTWGGSGIPQALNAGDVARAARIMASWGCGGEGNRPHAESILMLNQGYTNPATGAYVG